MAKEKEIKKQNTSEVVGLDDDDIEDGEQEAPKPGLLDKYKKYLLPASIAIGSFVIAMIGVTFINNSGNEIAEETATEDLEDSKKSVNPIITDQPEFVEEGLDTSAIMAELAFLDYTPEMEAEANRLDQFTDGSPDGEGDGSGGIAGMTPQDSVDTLNWLDKELAKLDESKANSAKQIKKLKALEYKIDQALIKIEQAESSRIINLARLYDGMRPEQVGKLFENLSDKAIMAILPRMKSANAAKIMAIMPPKRAARISTKMITVLEQ